ncbi:RNA polymerase sigma factor, sigma-70 family [Ruaniaceae bacterium KH17]|nr:RNA polymerase sigma factor, sigma-70 family [Ruaniaceae bacterium KH17]
MFLDPVVLLRIVLLPIYDGNNEFIERDVVVESNREGRTRVRIDERKWDEPVHSIGTNDAEPGTHHGEDSNPLNDNLLVEPFQGDAASIAFEALVREMSSELVRYAQKRVREGEHEDLVSRTWEVVWRRWEDIPATGSQRRGWVFGILKNTISGYKSKMLSRQENAHKIAATLPRESGSGAFEDDVVARDLVERVLSDLPLNYEIAFRRIVLEGFRMSDVAAEMGVNVSTLGTWVSRARVALRSHMDQERSER